MFKIVQNSNKYNLGGGSFYQKLKLLVLFYESEVINGQLAHAPLFQRASGQNLEIAILFKIVQRPNNLLFNNSFDTLMKV